MLHPRVLHCHHLELQVAFQCYPHPEPNTQRSLIRHPDVLCFSQEWLLVTILADCSLLVFVFAPVATALAVMGMSFAFSRAGKFQKRWKWVFVFFDPGCWWWPLVG